MTITSLENLTLLDFPGKVAMKVYTQGCNFNCPFCHNPALSKIIKVREAKFQIRKEEVLDALYKRRHELDGLVIAGGEPTLHRDLLDFIQRVKDMGLLVKLDTYGSDPESLERVLYSKEVDYVSMDVKHSLHRYPEAIGQHVDIEQLKRSSEIVRSSGVDYEFRTKYVPSVHIEEDFHDISDWLFGAKRYFLEYFRGLIPVGSKPFVPTLGQLLDLERVRDSIKHNFDFVGVR